MPPEHDERVPPAEADEPKAHARNRAPGDHGPSRWLPTGPNVRYVIRPIWLGVLGA